MIQLWAGWGWGALIGLGAFALASALWLAHDLGDLPWRDVPRPLQRKLLVHLALNIGIYAAVCLVAAVLISLAVSLFHLRPPGRLMSAIALFLFGIALPRRGQGGMEFRLHG